MENVPDVAQKLDNFVVSVIGAEKLFGFQRAFQMASAIEQLQTLLTPEYMTPIMRLQGNKLGFRTDKDKSGGYGEPVVKNCLIEAVLIGLQPTGNHFNIIAGNMYPTKEGLGYLLANFPGLSYKIVTGLPRVNNDKTSCAVPLTITWQLGGKEDTVSFEQPIKIDQYASVDSMLGKATRKGRAWLYSKITGSEITDGEVEDAEAKIVGTKINKKSQEEVEFERMLQLISDCSTIEELEMLDNSTPDKDVKFAQYFEDRKKEILSLKSNS